MGKKKSGLLNIKRKSENLNQTSNSLISFSSTFEYEKFGLTDISSSLKESEEKIYISLMNIEKSTFEIAEELYKVNQELSNRGNGSYMEWCSSLGINKDKSSVLLKKYNLYLLTKKKETMELPIPVVKVLTSKKNQLTDDEVLTIVESEKPSQKLKEVKERYSQVANILEAEVIETEEEKEIKLKEEIKYLKQVIKEREAKLKEYYSKLNEKEKELNGNYKEESSVLS